MAYGVIEYNESGLPMCEVCGRFFSRVLTHVRQKHNMEAREYKSAYGFDVSKGICSAQSRRLSQQSVQKNFDRVVRVNLLAAGRDSRFRKGWKGRTKDMVSEQTRLMLHKRFKRLARSSSRNSSNHFKNESV